VIRVATATAALVVALALVALAVDVSRWRHAADRPPTLVGHVAESLLGTSDDVALHRAVAAFAVAEATPYGFDNGLTQTRVRVLAQAQLSQVASASPARQAAQAYDLLGVLAWGAPTAPTGVLDPADEAVGAFTNAVRLDPGDRDAKLNLEIALRALVSRGVRPGANSGTGPRGTGHGGAGAGSPGSGY
jgi:hypothetical protein